MSVASDLAQPILPSSAPRSTMQPTTNEAPPQSKWEAELERRRCRCCLTEPQMRGTIMILFGCTLLAYIIYGIVQCAVTNAHPQTTAESVDQDTISSPGIVICPLDPAVLPTYNASINNATYGETSPMVLLNHTSQTRFMCQRIAADGSYLLCPYRFVDFQFRAVSPGIRRCLEVDPGISLRSTRDFVLIQYSIGQNCSGQLRNCNNIDGVFYGLFTSEADKNDTLIQLTGGGGRSVVQFQSTQYHPLRGPIRSGFTVVAATSAALLPSGIEYNGDMRILPGGIVLAPYSMTLALTTEVWSFTPLQLIGAIGGVYSLLKGVVIFLQGFDPDEGILRRLFYPSKREVAAAAAAAAAASGERYEPPASSSSGLAATGSLNRDSDGLRQR